MLAASAIALVMSSNMTMAAKAADGGSFIDDLDKSFSITSNYVWRGISQGGDNPAVQGGVTYKHDSGVSVDFWLSSSAGGSNEYDITVSYAGKAADFGYEAGIVSYSYPQVDGGGFHEFFGGLKFNKMNAYVYINPDSAFGDNTYIELSADVNRFNLALGVNSNDFAALDYNQVTVKVNLTKKLSLAVSQTDADFDDTELALTYKMPIK